MNADKCQLHYPKNLKWYTHCFIIYYFHCYINIYYYLFIYRTTGCVYGKAISAMETECHRTPILKN